MQRRDAIVAAPRRFRFRPRFRGIAWSTIGLGAALGVTSLVLGVSGAPLIGVVVATVFGVGLGSAYLGSPAWRLEVAIDDEALEVWAAGVRRFRLPWAEVVRVIASPTTRTCFVDGGEPGRSLLVPGDGASAPYDLEDKDALYAAILARAPAAVIREVALLETARAELAAEAAAAGGAADQSHSTTK